jgi:hypothetical protein
MILLWGQEAYLESSLIQGNTITEVSIAFCR